MALRSSPEHVGEIGVGSEDVCFSLRANEGASRRLHVQLGAHYGDGCMILARMWRRIETVRSVPLRAAGHLKATFD